MNGPGEEFVPPTDRLVVEVMEASGEGEAEVVECIRYLYHERGLKPGTRNGPRHYQWFITTVQDHFDKKRAREEVANPVGYDEWEERNLTRAETDRMTDAIELPDAPTPTTRTRRIA